MADETTGTEVATQQKPKTELFKFGEQLQDRARQIQMALPSHISIDKFQRTLLTTVQSDPELLKADRMSLMLACMKAAQDGLLPDKREAAIVVFKENKKVEGGAWQTRLIATYLPMVYGLRKKILQSNEVAALEVNVVYRAEVDAGKFLYEVGLEPPLRHRPMLELTAEQTADSEIVAAYSIATMKDGTRSYEVMRRFEIDRVRETSKTGATRDRNGQPRKASGPWVDWFPEMAKKTVMRRHAKTLPQSGDLIVDVEGEELEHAGRSTAAILGSTDADAPQIEHRPEEETPHDPESGEIQETDERIVPDQQEELEPKKRTRRTRAQIDADNAAAALQQGEPAIDPPNVDLPPPGDEPPVQGQGQPDEDVDGTEPEQPEEDEQVENDIHPAMESARDIKALFARAALLIDLDRYYNESQLDISAMPEDIAADVEATYRERRQALGGK